MYAVRFTKFKGGRLKMNKRRIPAGLLLLVLMWTTLSPSAFVLAASQGFDGDGHADLAIGVPYEDVSSTTDAGSVSVLYGTTGGLSGTDDDYWQQNYLDGSNAEIGDNFGLALAAGDFNGDGYFDLAVGVPREGVGSVARAGAVNIIYGTGDGLDTPDNQYWNQDEAGMGGSAETDDHFGEALAAGDFNGDGYDDLAIGIPDEDIGSTVDAGGMMVLYGSADGLTASPTVWNQGIGAEAGDRYGATLAAGDFDGDGYDDLAVGIPREDLLSTADSGAVQIYYGSAGGIYARTSNDFWHQDRTGVADSAEAYDLFGAALTTGDFNGDGYDDLAVGVPYEDVSSGTVITDAGAVNVLYGSDAGITGSGSDYWHQDVGAVQSLCEEEDRFGFALTAGDFDGDGYEDLAIGVPYESWYDPNTGVAQVLYGTESGLTDIGNQLWRQGNTYGTEEEGDRFGYALAAGDFNGDSYTDLAIGVPYEDLSSGTVFTDVGAVNVIYGTATGLNATDDQFWYQGRLGVQGTFETGDRFGYALVAIPRRYYKVYLPLALRNAP